MTNQLQETGADHPQNQKNKNKRDGSRDADDRLRDIPEWSEEFTENLEDTEVPAPRHISEDSDSQHLTKVVTTSRKSSIKTHFPKDRNCDVCLRTPKNKRLLAEDALAKLHFVQKSLVT